MPSRLLECCLLESCESLEAPQIEDVLFVDGDHPGFVWNEAKELDICIVCFGQQHLHTILAIQFDVAVL